MAKKVVAAASAAALMAATAGCGILNPTRPWGEFYADALVKLTERAGHSDVYIVHVVVPAKQREKDSTFDGALDVVMFTPGTRGTGR